MGETRVDLLHLLEDLRDAYPGSLEETILTEIVANALDSGAATIRLEAAPAESTPSAILERHGEPLPEEQRGIALSTYGKVIKRGWDWLGLMPATADRVTGTIEAPALAESLTLSKADFIRTGPRGASYLTYRKAIQEAVSAQLALWGDPAEEQPESRRRHTRPVERDLENVLVELARKFPLLASLVEHRRGGQKRLALGGPAAVGASLHDAGETSGQVVEESAGGPAEGESPAERSPAAESPTLAVPMPLPGGRGNRRPARYGLTIQFERRPSDPALGRLVESTVWVNEEHPAYRRAVASRSEGYHLALTVGMALAPLAVPAAETHGFVTSFLAEWGESADGARGRGRKRRR